MEPTKQEIEFFKIFEIKLQEITDTMMLKLIVLTLNYYDYPRIKNVEHLERKTLSFLIKLYKENKAWGYSRQNKTLVTKVQRIINDR